MNVRELKEALLNLGPEYDESVVLVCQPGMYSPEEATRIITIPKIKNVVNRFSWEIFERAVWIDIGGLSVSKAAAEEGWRVPYANQTLCQPSPLTRTPIQEYEDSLKKWAAKRHVACATCYGEWQRAYKLPEGICRIYRETEEYCCHCGALSEPVAWTVEGKPGCEAQHGETPSEEATER